jgi:acyl-CoA thioesterase II
MPHDAAREARFAAEDKAALDRVIRCLDLRVTGPLTFAAPSIRTAWGRVFGGQVIAQALAAANVSVDPAFAVHSLHAYFILAGDSAAPVDLAVEAIRDGRTFATRRVIASQGGPAIFALSASFQKRETGMEFQAAMPENVPAPATLASDRELALDPASGLPDLIRRAWLLERAFTIKPLSLDHYRTTDNLPPRQRVWLKWKGVNPGSVAMRAALLAYMSDMTLLDSTLHVHGTSIFDFSLQVASLDHAMWFHTDADISGWLLYDQDSPWTGGGRGLAHGRIFTEDGRLIASVAQEGLIRRR